MSKKKYYLYRLVEYAMYLVGFLLIANNTSIAVSLGVSLIALSILFADIRLRNGN